MRRSDREIAELPAIEEILKTALVCRLAFKGEEFPYIVPLNFGYKDRALYFHCAPVGLKLDCIRRDNKVAFCVDEMTELIRADEACRYSAKYRSVVGEGLAEIVTDPALKVEALNIIMSKFDSRSEFHYNEKDLKAVVAIRVEILRMTGKQK